MDVVRLKPFDFAQAAAKAGMRMEGLQALRPNGPLAAAAGVSSAGAAARAAQAPSFASAIDQALRTVSHNQNESTRMQREVQLDNPTVSLEETMVAMQRAQIGFQAAVQVRNRLVSAYTEIMSMQV